MALTKVKINLGTEGNLSGSRSIIQSTKTLVSSSAQIATDISGSITSVSSSTATRIAANLASINTLNGSGTAQGVGTSDSPTFNDVTVTGTLTAQEVHTEFESASILFTSGSTKFGNSGDDIHNMTGSIRVSGSLANESFILGHNLGIGTNNPSNLLHLEFNDDSDVFTAARITDNSVSGILINNLDTGNGHGGMLKFANKDGDNHTAIAHSQDGNTDASLLFYSMDGGSLAEVMRVDHTHRIGIGNAGPSYKLDITENAETNVVRFHNDGGDQNRDVMILQGGADSGPGNTRFITFNDGDGGAFGFIQGPANGATAGISFNTTADTSLLTLSGSRVGIGTVNPSSLLHVSASSGTVATIYGGSSPTLLFEAGAGDTNFIFKQGGSNRFLLGYEDSDAGFRFYDYNSSTTMVFFKNGGNVGIGTTNPGVQLDIYNTDHAVMRLLAGTNKSASMRLKNDAQDWDVNCQTTDNFAIYDQTGGAAALTIAPSTYAATFSGDVTISKNDAKLTVFASNTGDKEAIVIDRNTASNGDSQEIRWKLQGDNYPGGYILHEYDDASNSSLAFGVRSSGTPATALSINSSKNSTFNGSVTSNTGFVTNEGNLRRLSSATINDNNVNDVAQVNQKSFLVYVNDSAGGFSSIVLHTGGSGIAYNWHMFDTDSNTWFENASTITSTGTNGNTYNFSFNTGNGYIRIQRTNGSLSYDIRLYQIFE